MYKKYLVCFFVSLTMALMLPFVNADIYVPSEEMGTEINSVNYEYNEFDIHESKKVGLIGKINFFSSSSESIVFYLTMVLQWFIALFLASSISTFFNRNKNRLGQSIPSSK